MQAGACGLSTRSGFMLYEIFSIGGFTLYGYGLMIAIGIVLAVIMGCIRAKRRGLKVNAIIDLAIIAVVTGFIGGKLFYLIFESKEFFEHPLQELSSSGFVVYGGIIIATICCTLYCKLKKLNFFSYYDIVLPSLALAQGFGRLGCFCAGCCYGRETASAFSVVFPDGCLAPPHVHLIPTQLLMAAGDFIIALVLILYSNKTKKRGFTGSLYFVLYAIGRFVIEFFRNDYRGNEIGFMSTSQFISVFILIFAIIMFVVSAKKNLPADRVLSAAEREERAKAHESEKVSDAEETEEPEQTSESMEPDKAEQFSADEAPEEAPEPEETVEAGDREE